MAPQVQTPVDMQPTNHEREEETVIESQSSTQEIYPCPDMLFPKLPPMGPAYSNSYIPPVFPAEPVPEWESLVPRNSLQKVYFSYFERAEEEEDEERYV